MYGATVGNVVRVARFDNFQDFQKMGLQKFIVKKVDGWEVTISNAQHEAVAVHGGGLQECSWDKDNYIVSIGYLGKYVSLINPTIEEVKRGIDDGEFGGVLVVTYYNDRFCTYDIWEAL